MAVDITIRRFEAGDAPALAAMIARTLRISNAKDYSAGEIAALVKAHSPEFLLRRDGWTHFYVACAGGSPIGCGAIGPYWDSEVESSLFTIFVDPDWQGQGVGRRIIRTLEADEYFLRARRVEIPASITGCGFYRHLGYNYKDGVDVPDGEGLYRLEKRRGDAPETGGHHAAV